MSMRGRPGVAVALLVTGAIGTGCGQVSNLTQGGACGLNQVSENVENPPQGEQASVAGYRDKTLDEAEVLADSRGHVVRVVGVDGECKGTADDFSLERVNVYIEDGVVEAAEAF